MKGDEAEYIVPLTGALKAPKNKRLSRTITLIKRFVKKHTRIGNVSITNEVNEFLNKNSKNLPRKAEVVLRKTGKKGSEKITVYLKGSKQLEEDKKKAAETAKKAKEKEAKKAEKKEGKKAEKKEEAADKDDDKKKLEEKREKEKAAQALERQGK